MKEISRMRRLGEKEFKYLKIMENFEIQEDGEVVVIDRGHNSKCKNQRMPDTCDTQQVFDQLYNKNAMIIEKYEDLLKRHLQMQTEHEELKKKYLSKSI